MYYGWREELDQEVETAISWPVLLVEEVLLCESADLSRGQVSTDRRRRRALDSEIEAGDSCV